MKNGHHEENSMITGIYRGEELSFYENETFVKIKKEDQQIVLLRKNNEKNIRFVFGKEKSYVTISMKEGTFVTEIDVKNKIWENGIIDFQYKIEEDIHIHIEYEIIER